jgi:hypothetical protein
LRKRLSKLKMRKLRLITRKKLKNLKMNCDKNSQRIDKIARFNDRNKNEVIEQCEGENVGSTFY